MSTDEKYQIDMCHGPLLGKIIRFTMPLVFTGVLQLLFNMADLIVIGRFASKEALAAIGATAALNALIIGLFGGIAVGANVLVARAIGAKNRKETRRSVHTSIAAAFWLGILLMIAAILTARPMLIWMDTPGDILEQSCRYIWICFAAIPFIMLYNFGCSVLRAMGDTKRPLYILIFAGIVNVVLNLFLVIFLGMDVEGVAIATAVSHCISACLVMLLLFRTKGDCRLYLKHIRIHWQEFRGMMAIGIPAGVQSSGFAVSNMIIQAAINSFGSLAVAGNTAAYGFEGIVFVGAFAFHQTAISFVAQNFGAGQMKRIVRITVWTILCGTVLCGGLGLLFMLTGDSVLKLYNEDPDVISWGKIRLAVLFSTYSICAVQTIATGVMRGLGYSFTAAVIVLFDTCILRAVWVWFIFPLHRTYDFLLWSYPVTWGMTGIVAIAFLIYCFRKLMREKVARHSSVWCGLQPGIPKGMRFFSASK